MAKTPVITEISGQYSLKDTINTNFDNIQEAFNNTLSRDGSTPNQMEADIDLNSNDLLNARNGSFSGELTVKGVDLLDAIQGTTGPATIFNTTNVFSGDGSTTVFTLTKEPIGRVNTRIYISGIYQQKSTYTVSGTTLTFSEAPPYGVNNIEVEIQEGTDVGTISADAIPTNDGQDVQAALDTLYPFESFSELADWWSDRLIEGYTPPGGTVVSVGGLSWTYIPVGHVLYGTDPISALPGWMPTQDYVSVLHWGVTLSEHDDAEPDVSVAVSNAEKMQEAIDWCAANAVTLEIPGGVIWVAGYSVRKTGLVMTGQQGVDVSVIKMHGAVHKNMPLSVSSIRGTVQSRITVYDVTFDANAARKDDVAQAATYGEDVITFDSTEREAAFGTATDTMYGTALIIGDQNDLDEGKSFYVRVRAKDGMRHSIDVTAPSSCRSAGDLAALGLPTGTATAYDPQPAKGVVLIDCFGTGAGDDNITTHHCSFVWMHRCIGYRSEGSRVPGNSNAVEIDDGSRNVWLMECAGIQCDGGLQIKGHNDAPAPYNIVVDGFTSINTRYGLEVRHTGWYGTGTDSEDPPPIVDEEGNPITLTGASATARNVIISNVQIIAPREYETGGVMRSAERGVRVRSYENLQLSNITVSDGAVDLQRVVDGYLPATTLSGPIFQVNGGASHLTVQTLNTRGMADAPYGIRVYSTAGKGIKFDGLTMIDAPLSPFYVSGDPGSHVSLANYAISGDWLGTPDSIGVRFSGPNFGGLGFGTVDGYNIHSTAPTLSRENTGPTMAYAGDLVMNGEIIARTNAVSTGDLATDPITGFNAQWVENVQDLGEGEGRGYVWSVVLYDSGAEEHLPEQIVARTYAKKVNSTDTDPTSDWWVQVSPDGTTANLQDVLGVDAPTGQVMAPLGFKPGETPGMPVVVASENVQHSHTGDTSETTLHSLTVPGGCMGPNGYLRITTLTSQTNNANNKTMRVKLGGATIVESVAGYTGSSATRRETVLANRNDQTVQIGMGAAAAADPGETAVAVSTYAINTASDMTLEVTAELSVGTDELALEYVIVEAVYLT